MSGLSFGELIDTALLQAGDDGRLKAQARTWLNTWLWRTERSWPWPFLLVRGQIALPAGTTDLEVTPASLGYSVLAVRQIRDPIYLFTADFKQRFVARVQQTAGAPLSTDQSGRDPATNLGTPELFKIYPSNETVGGWFLIPQPFPKEDLVLQMDFYFVERGKATDGTEDAETVQYPNDDTIIKALIARTLLYKDGHSPEFREAAQAAADALREDKMNEGQSTGINDVLELDGGTYSSELVPTTGFLRRR